MQQIELSEKQKWTKSALTFTIKHSTCSKSLFLSFNILGWTCLILMSRSASCKIEKTRSSLTDSEVWNTMKYPTACLTVSLWDALACFEWLTVPVKAEMKNRTPGTFATHWSRMFFFSLNSTESSCLKTARHVTTPVWSVTYKNIGKE